MADDKLRDLTPVDVAYVPGERPTDEKLENAEIQTREALEYLEHTVGDAYGESLGTDPAYISNLTRDIGDRSLLNPVLLPDVFELNYIQQLTLGESEHELDLIPVGIGAAIINSSADSSVLPSEFKSNVSELTEPGDWTILPGKTEGGVVKNSRKLVTHSPSSGGSITVSEVTSGRGSAYVGARHNTIPSVGQARLGGPFLTVTLSDAINNIYTIQLPTEDKIEDQLYDDTNATLSNTVPSVGTSQQMKLPLWLFDSAGLDMATDAGGGGPKTFPLNTIKIYDYQSDKIVDGLLEVKASNTAGLREEEIICTFRSDIILDTMLGQYLIVTSGTSISELLGAVVRDLYFHKHMGDDMIRGITHSDLYGLRTGDDTLDRTKYYGPSNIDKNDHSHSLHRDGYTATDDGAGGNIMRGSIVIGNKDTGSEPTHENYNLLDDSYSVTFGEIANGGQIYFDKDREQNLVEGRGNIPQPFEDTALVIEGSVDDATGTLKTTFIDGNLRVGKDVVLGTDATHDVFVSGDIYIKNSMTLIPRTVAGLLAAEETGMMVYSSDENAPVFWNGNDWINVVSSGYAVVIGDGVISFGKYSGATAATLQSAISDAVAQGGGIIKILRGNYNYGVTAVNIPSNVAIEGEGSSTKIDSSGVAFSFDNGSVHSELTRLRITNAAIGVLTDGSEHKIDDLDIHSCTTGITLVSTSSKINLGDNIRYDSTTTNLNILSTDKTNKQSVVEAVGYSERLYLTDPVNKARLASKWKAAASGVLTYVDDNSSMIGKGHFEITGEDLFIFEDYMPVMPEAGIGGYIGVYSNAASAVTIGFEAYDANLSPLATNGGFLTDTSKGNEITAGAWSYVQDVAVQEGLAITELPVGTRFIRASINVTANTGTVFFDGFELFPMTFSTITLYS